MIPCIYDDVHGFSEGLANVKNDGKFGYINNKGELVIPCIYDDDTDALSDFDHRSFWYFEEGLAYIGKNNTRGYIDKKGTEFWED